MSNIENSEIAVGDKVMYKGTSKNANFFVVSKF
jgi:hypothetical protein